MWKIAGSLENVDGKTAFDGMRAGDAAAKQVVDEYISYLAEGVINLVNIFRPEAIVLGGGVCAGRGNALAPLREKVSPWLFGGADYAARCDRRGKPRQRRGALRRCAPGDVQEMSGQMRASRRFERRLA